MKIQKNYIILFFILVILLSVFIYYGNYNKPYIPLNIFMTYSNPPPPEFKKNMEEIAKNNPEFQVYFFDNDLRREFIERNFDIDVLKSHDKLIPGAYKADLFRYCILYKYGGIYMDIKMKLFNDYKLIKLTDKEYFVRDIEESGGGVANAVIVSNSGNPILKKAIDEIVLNVKNEFYGTSQLEPTGPLLFRKILSEEELSKIELKLIKRENGDHHIVKGEEIIFFIDKDLVKIVKTDSVISNYMAFWSSKNMYDKNIIF
jgi:mannosyltransferase OCH1-like enzyme